MFAAPTFFFALGASLSLPITCYAGLIQKPDLKLPPYAEGHREHAKSMFLESYDAYRNYAFPHDNVAPISGGYSDGRNGWGATIIDSMSTMKIMGLDALFSEAVAHTLNVDFTASKTQDTVSVFETTIRYLGGILSAYELSDGQHPQLLTKAKQLADQLAHAWKGSSPIPWGHIDFQSNSYKLQTSNIAEAGTLSLEWATLAKHTGNHTYHNLGVGSARHIAEMQTPLPGLPGQGIDPKTGSAVGSYITWGGGSDSYFEYLIKYARLNLTEDHIFADTWRTAVDSSIKSLLKKSAIKGDSYLADIDNNGVVRHVSSHLACFHGGNWLMGGRLLNNETIFNIGLALVDGCWNTYAQSETGIGPDGFAYIPSDGQTAGEAPPTLEQLEFYLKHGFYVRNAYYVLRPEVLGSNYYAWRTTGDEKYLQRAISAMDSFRKYLRIQKTGGYAGLWDVNNPAEGFIDDTESFWYAEVLKYLFLTFDDPQHISLDEYVFNTEAHPFKVPHMSPDHVFGSGNMSPPSKPHSAVPGTLPVDPSRKTRSKPLTKSASIHRKYIDMRSAKLFCLLSAALPHLVVAEKIQLPGLKLPSSAAANRAAVVNLFNDSYAAYQQFAFGHDDVSPLSHGFSDDRNGWGASIVDAMSTMHIMGLDDLFLEAVNFSSKIDFSHSLTPDTVSVFETTIRYLGGLLSAYELSNQQFPVLLQKAQELGDKLAFAWSRGNVVPFGFLDFSSNTPSIATSNIAEAGTLSLEFETLSKHTGNQTYANLAIGSLSHIANLPAPLPGLAAQGIDPSSGNFVGGYVTWGGGSDSYFEYLIKHARLSNTDDNLFADTWHTAVDSSITTLLRTSTVGDHVYTADFDSSRQIRHVGSHLACFHGGNWLMGGKLLNNQTIIDVALQLIDGCWNTYAGDATGIGPESFAFISSDGNFTGGSSPTSAQLSFYNKNGYYITNGNYILRPEVLESNFYAWRVTGDTKYLDRAASAIQSFNTFLRTSTGFTGIIDVNNVHTGRFDDTQSFWFAEVLKYLYLTFDDPSHISLDDFVFNTEAHPFKAPPAKEVYGTATGRIRRPTAPFVLRNPNAPLPAVSPIPALRKGN
ncbi:hypothetical protein CVT24_012558 [Panaeolus cyanescens]|uniref:alpha-1,2-Mannosidase n=1 Tax=Panaeolus cyanescens TaxID=181874 RepID=A0A409W2H2_9AGAR|nr:hypothetical protein CVT24_012558 [Panaeolus cyanescens]